MIGNPHELTEIRELPSSIKRGISEMKDSLEMKCWNPSLDNRSKNPDRLAGLDIGSPEIPVMVDFLRRRDLNNLHTRYILPFMSIEGVTPGMSLYDSPLSPWKEERDALAAMGISGDSAKKYITPSQDSRPNEGERCNKECTQHSPSEESEVLLTY